MIVYSNRRHMKLIVMIWFGFFDLWHINLRGLSSANVISHEDQLSERNSATEVRTRLLKCYSPAR